MLEIMKWEDTYKLWINGCYYFPKILSAPLAVETVFVEYEKEDCYIYGFDWLENDVAQKRKCLIKENPFEFLYFTKSTNKGTIQTAEMLIEAQSDEERAAVWIAATAKELSEYRGYNNVWRYSNMLDLSACDFLKERYFLWHHAMKKLVPEILIPPSILKNIVCKDAESIIGLIQMNTILLKSTWSILRYSSLEDDKLLEARYRMGS